MGQQTIHIQLKPQKDYYTLLYALNKHIKQIFYASSLKEREIKKSMKLQTRNHRDKKNYCALLSAIKLNNP